MNFFNHKQQDQKLRILGARSQLGLSYILLPLFVTLSNMTVVHAVWEWEGADWWDKLNEIYTVIKGISLPLGAVVIAVCFLAILFGTQKDMEKMLGRVKFVIFAIVCIQLLPLVVAWGKTLMNGSALGGLPAPDSKFLPTPSPSIAPDEEQASTIILPLLENGIFQL